MLGATRTLYGLARDGNAPKIFLKTNRFGIPWVCVALFGASISLGYMTLSNTPNIVFTWLQDLVSVAILLNWLVICIVYLRFYYGCRKQGISRNELPWKAPLQPYATWISFVGFVLLLLTGGYTTFIHGQWVSALPALSMSISWHRARWSDESFVSSYINIPIIFLLYFGYKFIRKTKLVSLSEMPIRQFMDIARDNPEAPLPRPTGWRRFNILWSWMSLLIWSWLKLQINYQLAENFFVVFIKVCSIL